ncbi:hypothetical protein E8E12_007990 [Didymella heteroderae]|uniref:Uncharacterized protein n=1 Tax=Didymella heteroderae TaxID=1769908 RepID=A0A9P4WN96_9PLEO|nr:hypothetical protein E8E12_007990 [Didymella heteroderae]
MPDEIIDDFVEGLEPFHNGGHEGMIPALAHACANDDIARSRDAGHTPADETNMPIFHATAAELKPAPLETAATAAAPVTAPAVKTDSASFLMPTSRIQSWAEEKEEEEEAAAAEAAAKAATEAVTEAAGKTVAELAEKMKDAIVTDAAPEGSANDKKKASRRRKQKRTAKKVQAAAVSSLSTSEASFDASTYSAENSEVLLEARSPAKTFVASPDSPPAKIQMHTKLPLTTSLEPALEESTPAAAAAADSWDDWIETVPTIAMHNYEIARDREFEAEKEAQAQHAAGLPPVDDGVVTAADLLRRHEEAAMARLSVTTDSLSSVKAVVDAVPDVEDLQESGFEIDDVEPPAVPISASVDPPAIAAAAEAEDVHVAIPEVYQEPVMVPKQATILGFFKKSHIVTVHEVSSSTSPERSVSSAEPAESVAIMNTDLVDANGDADDIQTAAPVIEMKSEAGKITPADLRDDSEASFDATVDGVIVAINVTDYLDYLADTDDEGQDHHGFDDFVDAEELPLLSPSITSAVDDDQVAPEPAPVASSTEQVATVEAAYDSNIVDDNVTATSGAHEPVVSRQKQKKRTKAERNAAKKRTAAAAAVAATTASHRSTASAGNATTATNVPLVREAIDKLNTG